MPTLNNQFRLKLSPNTIYNFSIDWGDGSREIFQGTTPSTDANAGISHTYATGGNYNVSITENVVGGFAKPYFDGFRNTDPNNDDIKVKNIKQWGKGTFLNLSYSFAGCTNLQIAATDHPTSKLNLVTDLNSAWYNCNTLSFFPSIDTSNVTNFNSTWFNCGNIKNFPLLDMSKMTEGINCFNGVKLDIDIYSQLLQFLAENNFNTNVIFHAGSKTTYYPYAQPFRDILTNTRNWQITDGGMGNSLNFTKTGGTLQQRDVFDFFTNPVALVCGAGCTNTSATFGVNDVVVLDYNVTPSITCSEPNVFYTTSRSVSYTFQAGSGLSMIGNGILTTGEFIVVDSSLSIDSPLDGTPYVGGDGIRIQYKEITITMNGNIDVFANISCN